MRTMIVMAAFYLVYVVLPTPIALPLPDTEPIRQIRFVQLAGIWGKAF